MIFYFSGTGNTRWAAEQLAAATHERLLFIPDELQGDCTYTLHADERIGFCFPVHGWQPPHIVRQFISRLTITQQPSSISHHPSNISHQPSSISHHPSSISHHPSNIYSYALCTCGDSIGLAMTMLAKELSAKGITLQSCQSLTMPESYVCLPFMYTDTPEREREKIEQAKVDLEKFIEVVVNRRSGYSQLTLGLTPWTFSHVIGAYFNSFMITDRKFTVDADRCLHCGKCAKVCPVGDIELRTEQSGASSPSSSDTTSPSEATNPSGAVPYWLHDDRCTCCLSCYHHCPVHAINYGRITRKRGQYYFGHSK